jgi:hypothetical protein
MGLDRVSSGRPTRQRAALERTEPDRLRENLASRVSAIMKFPRLEGLPVT